MDVVAENLVAALQYLLPGFLAAWVFYGLTPHPKPSQFERVVQAFIFTLFVQAIVGILKPILIGFGESTYALGPWDTNSELLTSVIAAMVLGCVFSYGANSDVFHKIARKIGITKLTSYPSEWFGTFQCDVTYVVLELKDSRRLYGWPQQWPSEPGKGHFNLTDVSWLVTNEEGNQAKEIPLQGVQSILISASEVRWVEFMAKTWEKKNGTESAESSAPPARK